MFECINTVSQTVSASGSVTFTLVTVSDNYNRIKLSDSQIININEIGKYSVDGVFNVYNSTSSAVEATLQLYADGTAVNGTETIITVPASGYAQAIISKIIKVIPASYGDTAKLTFISSSGATIVNALVDVCKCG